VEELHAYIERKRVEQQSVHALICRPDALNPRQIALLAHAVAHRDAHYTHESQAKSNLVSIVTARSDLQALVRLGYLSQRSNGRKLITPPRRGSASCSNGESRAHRPRPTLSPARRWQ
jgi:Fic family protein